MDIAMQSAQSVNPVMPEIYLINQPQGEGELPPSTSEASGVETFLPQASVEGKGFLIAEGGKFYSVNPESSSLPSKITDTLSEINKPKETKSLDLKEGKHDLSFKENIIKEKEFKVHESQNQQVHEKRSETKLETFQKVDTLAQKMGTSPLKAAPPKPMLVAADLHRKEVLERKEASFKKLEKREERENSKAQGAGQTVSKKPLEENHKTANYLVERKQDEDREQKKKNKEERQGFAEDQKKQNQERESGFKRELKVTARQNLDEQVYQYGQQDSILSEILLKRVSQFDVLILFFEVLKLALKGREQERISRQHERELQILHMQKVVENFKKQSKYHLRAGIGAGIFAIVSGLCPILGHLKGEWIRDNILGNIPMAGDKFRTMEASKLFNKMLPKTTMALSKMQESMGQVQTTFAEGERNWDQHKSELHKSDAEEDTRSMEEIKDFWKNIENFLYQMLQMHHDVVRQLFGN